MSLDLRPDRTTSLFGGGSGGGAGTSAHGEMYVHDNTTGLTFTNDDTFYKWVTGWTAGDSDGVTVDPTTNHRITVNTDGTYLVTCAVSFSGTINETFEAALYKNGTVVPGVYLERKLGAGGDVGSASFIGIIDLVEDDYLEVFFKSTSGAGNSVVAREMNFSASSISGTAASGDHGTLTGLTDDDHTQYAHISTARTIAARHTFNPGSASSPFILGANAADQLVTGLNADKLDGSDATAFAAASHTHAASDVTSGQLALARGGTNADLSATGGALQVLKQLSSGGAVSVAAILAAEIPNLAATILTSGTLGDARLSTKAKTRVIGFTIPAASVAVGAIQLPFRFPDAWTVQRITHWTESGTATWNIEERTAPATSGTNVYSSDEVSSTTVSSDTSFNNAGMAADNYMALDISAVSTPGNLHIVVEYTVDD